MADDIRGAILDTYRMIERIEKNITTILRMQDELDTHISNRKSIPELEALQKARDELNTYRNKITNSVFTTNTSN